MNNTSNAKSSLILCHAILILISLTLNSRADESEWFVELDATNGFYASPGVPEAAIAALKDAQKNNYELKSFAFTPTGDWIVLDVKGFKTSDDELRICQVLHKSDRHFEKINCFVINPSGNAGAISYQDGGRWGEGDGPIAAWNQTGNLPKSGHRIRSISYGPSSGWVILYDKTGISYGDIPDNLAKVLDNAVNQNTPIQCVSFSGHDWICLGQDNWWASNTNLPAAKFVEQSFELGQHPKWIAFVPSLGSFSAAKFGTIIRQTMAGRLAGGYECEVINHGKVVVALADGWARAPWEKVNPAVKMTINKPIDLASVSKTITAVAILKLCEECAGTSRQFSLDEPFWPHISEICPEVNKDVKIITMRQVLKHRGGFTNDFGNSPGALKQLLSLPLPHAPGTFFKYQNVDYYIVHLLIEQISGMDYTDYVKTHVLVPMGITDMDTRYNDNPKMCFYGKPGSQDQGDGYQGDNSSSAGPSGWYASAADMGIFLEGIRKCHVLSHAITAMMLKENLGWDGGNPWTKGGLLPGPNDRRIHTDIAYFPDGVEAVILLNCAEPTNCQNLLVQAWKDAHY